MSYDVAFTPAAARDFSELTAKNQKLIAPRIDSLGERPRLPGSKLRGAKNRHRIRVGDYRVIYDVNDSARMVIVLRIRHRRDAYRNL